MAEQDDDEISIDFSKIKNIFKKKAEKEKVQVVEQKAEEIESYSHSAKDKERVEGLKDQPRKQEDEEISFDFSKITGFFKKLGKDSGNSHLKKGGREKQSSDDEFSFDFRKAWSFINKHKVLLLILIPLLFSVYLRTIPGHLPITDNWAESTLLNGAQQQIESQVRSQYPNLPEENINNLISTQMQQLLNAERGQFEQQVSLLSEQFKSRLQKDGQTYLIAIDPYFWMLHAQSILERGYPGDLLRNPQTMEECSRIAKDCVPWDQHMEAPLGRKTPYDMFHAYAVAYTHKILSIFNPKQDIMSSAFIVPIILASLCVIPAFFIARKVGGNFAGFVAGFFVAIHPAFLTRTVGGFSDTDAYNVLFPLLITWLFLEAYEVKQKWKSILITCSAGLAIGLYSVTWGGWWYIFDFIIGSLVIYLIIYVLIHRDEIKVLHKQETIRKNATIGILLFVSTLIFTSIISEFSTFMQAFRGPLNFITFKEVGISTIWPNVITTVAEQNAASLNSVITQIGTNSLVIFILSIFGITLTLLQRNSSSKIDLYYTIISLIWISIVLAIRPDLPVMIALITLPLIAKIVFAIYSKDTAIDFKLAIILIIWFTSTLYASTKGVRFMLLLVPAASIGLGIALGHIVEQVSRFMNRSLDLNRTLSKSIIVLVLLFALFISPFNTARATASQEIPSMNDAWYSALEKVRLESEPDAIINSWWDFGHWFKAIGNRAVTFDGTSQNTPMAHWIGHVLLTNDEDKAVGLLRMLDCGSNSAFEKLDAAVNDGARSVSILHTIAPLNREDAKKELLKYTDNTQAEEVLRYSHCTPPENYFITSDDMIGKSGVWGHFGSWDFDRALIYNTLKKKEFENDKEKSVSFLKERFSFSDEEAEEFFFEVRNIQDSNEANNWIAPWPGYASTVIGCQNRNEDIIVCPVNGRGGTLNMEVNLKEKTAAAETPVGVNHPQAIAFITKEGIEKTEYKNNTFGAAMTLIPQGDSWNYIMSASPLEDSMFTRLFFTDGHGLKKFKKFTEEHSVVGNRIIVWKVDWEGKEENKVFFNEEEQDAQIDPVQEGHSA